ncbi:hypothetical protein Tco_0085706 [Tanacetum coccineum]
MTFDETPPPSKTSPLVDDDLDEEEAIKVTEKKNLENDIEDETLEIDKIVNIKESRNRPLENGKGVFSPNGGRGGKVEVGFDDFGGGGEEIGNCSGNGEEEDLYLEESVKESLGRGGRSGKQEFDGIDVDCQSLGVFGWLEQNWLCKANGNSGTACRKNSREVPNMNNCWRMW